MTIPREQELLDRAAKLATEDLKHPQATPAMPPRQQPSPQQQVVPIEGFARLIEIGVLTPQQVFELVFQGKPPAEFRGTSDK